MEESKKIELSFDGRLNNQRETMEVLTGRLEKLEEESKFGPDKMSKIHNSLEHDFTIAEQELVEKKTVPNQFTQQQALARELRAEMSKVKD